MFDWQYRPYWRLRLPLTLLVLTWTCLSVAQSAKPEPPVLVPETDNAAAMVERLRLKWELEGIEAALQSGFLRVADTLSGRLLATTELPRAIRIDLLGDQLQIALLRGDLMGAASSIEAIREQGGVPDPILESFFLYFTGAETDLRERVRALKDQQWAAGSLAWLRLLEGLLAIREDDLDAANEAFRLAALEAPNDLLKDQFEIIRYRENLASGRFDEVTVSALRESVRSMQGERGGFEAARLLAVALNGSGEPAEAIEVLNSQLALPGFRESGLRSDFLLLIGVIAGPDSARGRLALREVIADASNIEHQSLALTLLAQAIDDRQDQDVFMSALAEWLARLQPHPLADRFLAYQAFFAASTGDFDLAGSSAQELLDRFPNSSFVPNALRLLAYTSWSQTPPRYRTAADFLNRLRQRFPASDDSIQAGILIADCYFLNGDFTNASDMYGTILMDAPPELASDVFYQRALSEIGAGRVAVAAAMIDTIRSDARVSEEALWRAEWNLIDYMRRNQMSDEAYGRIQVILETSDETPAISASLALRFRWLAARLTLEAGPPAEAAAKARALLGEIETDSFGLDPSLLSQVKSHLLLLQGEAQIASGQRQDGIAIFNQLRQTFPESGPAILSYLVESRTESATDNLVSAQQSLVSLVDRFPGSEYAPIALWEAALNAEQRGLNVHLREAIGILERLVSDYPDHDLVYYARLKQGDLARRLNDFPTALLLYERLLSQYRDHPERYRAELSRADCLMALGSEDSDRFDQAAVIYERNCLLPTAPLPIRAEAGFKWAHSLRQQDDLRGSEAVYWLLYERFIQDPDLSRAIVNSEAGRYWLARILLELGAIQVTQGEPASAGQIYQTLLRMNLPGSALAKARLAAIRQQQ